MIKYRILIDCPNDQKLINKLIDAASRAGAGKIEKYSRCATVLTGWNTWKSGKRANPHIGKIGEISKVSSARIEMECTKSKVRNACEALRKTHPYEEPFIQVIKLDEQ